MNTKQTNETIFGQTTFSVSLMLKRILKYYDHGNFKLEVNSFHVTDNWKINKSTENAC